MDARKGEDSASAKKISLKRTSLCQCGGNCNDNFILDYQHLEPLQTVRSYFLSRDPQK